MGYGHIAMWLGVQTDLQCLKKITDVQIFPHHRIDSRVSFVTIQVVNNHFGALPYRHHIAPKTPSCVTIRSVISMTLAWRTWMHIHKWCCSNNTIHTYAHLGMHAMVNHTIDKSHIVEFFFEFHECSKAMFKSQATHERVAQWRTKCEKKETSSCVA